MGTMRFAAAARPSEYLRACHPAATSFLGEHQLANMLTGRSIGKWWIAMAHVVIVHGISHQLDAADTIREEWLPALAGGVRNAGFEAIADRLSPDSGVADRFDVRAAFYGAMFREPGRQGGAEGDLPPELQDIADDLAVAYLIRAYQAEGARTPGREGTGHRGPLARFGGGVRDVFSPRAAIAVAGNDRLSAGVVEGRL